MRIKVDTTGDVPTAEDCQTYHIRSLSIDYIEDVAQMTLDFDGALAHEDALRFLRDWMKSDDPEGDLAVALS